MGPIPSCLVHVSVIRAKIESSDLSIRMQKGVGIPAVCRREDRFSDPYRPEGIMVGHVFGPDLCRRRCFAEEAFPVNWLPFFGKFFYQGCLTHYLILQIGLSGARLLARYLSFFPGLRRGRAAAPWCVLRPYPGELCRRASSMLAGSPK